MFTRRNLNIESLTVSDSELPNVHRFTIVVKTDAENARKLTQQLEKQVEVLKAFYHQNDALVYQEIALYKLPTSVLIEHRAIEQLVREHQARVLTMDPDFAVVEKTGHHSETQALLQLLEPYGVLEFVRSGRVAITKPMKELQDHLQELEITTQVA